MKKKGKRMSETKKIKAVQLVTEGHTRTEVAKKFAVSTTTLDAWRKKYADRIHSTNQTIAHASNTVRRADTALAQLKQENLELYAMVGRMVLGREIEEIKVA